MCALSNSLKGVIIRFMSAHCVIKRLILGLLYIKMRKAKGFAQKKKGDAIRAEELFTHWGCHAFFPPQSLEPNNDEIYKWAEILLH